jgi:sulfoxide reductase heme-binding subunit YedZ
VLFIACLLPLAWLVWRGVNGRLGANPIRKTELETGLWTIRLLALTLLVTPLRQLTGWNEAVRYRRMLGLFTFFYASLHLSAYVGLDMFFDLGDIGRDILEHPYVTMGMLTFLLLVPLAVTSTKASIRRLGGRRWNRLHQLVYVAAVTATIHYLWSVKKDTLWPAVYFVTFACLLGWRLWTRLAAARATRATRATPTA